MICKDRFYTTDKHKDNKPPVISVAVGVKRLSFVPSGAGMYEMGDLV